MSNFKNKKIQEGSGKDFFMICKILEKLENEEEIKFIKNYIDKISISNQECRRLLKNIYLNAVGISQSKTTFELPHRCTDCNKPVKYDK